MLDPKHLPDWFDVRVQFMLGCLFLLTVAWGVLEPGNAPTVVSPRLDQFASFAVGAMLVGHAAFQYAFHDAESAQLVDEYEP